MKPIVLTIFLLGVSAISHAQLENGDGPIGDRIKSLKVAYITSKLDLTTEESQAFWPVYNEYEDKQEAIRKETELNGKLDALSDEELEQAILRTFEREERLLELKREYFEHFKDILSIRKIALLKQAEVAFNKELVRRLSELQQRREGFRRRSNN